LASFIWETADRWPEDAEWDAGRTPELAQPVALRINFVHRQHGQAC
jgi:hypothetical protein